MTSSTNPSTTTYKSLIPKWTQVNEIAVDVETQTRAKAEWPDACHRVTELGLTALAPLLTVALYHPDLGSLVIDFADWDPYTLDQGHIDSWEDFEDRWQFLQEVLCRPNLTIVGHNVVFDLRQIGVHANYFHNRVEVGAQNVQDKRYQWPFWLPVGCHVWDTYVLGQVLMLGELFSSKGVQFADSFGLIGQPAQEAEGRKKAKAGYLGFSERMGLIDTESDFYKFYTFMKDWRDDLTSLSSWIEQAAERQPQHFIWKYLGGLIPPNRKDLLAQAAHQLITDYVAADAEMAFNLYQKQEEIANHLTHSDWKHGKLLIPKWPRLMNGDIHPKFKGIIDVFKRRLRNNANRAIRGAALNLVHLRDEKENSKKIIEVYRKEVLEEPDKNDPYPQFEDIFGTMMYFSRILALWDYMDKTEGLSKKEIVERGIPNVVMSNPLRWAFWKREPIARSVFEDALVWDEELDEDLKMYYVTVLYTHLEKTETYTKRGEVANAHPGIPLPRIDMKEWIRKNCFADYTEPLQSFLSEIKTDWLRYYYTRPRAEIIRKQKELWIEAPRTAPEGWEAFSPDEVLTHGIEQAEGNFINSRKWIPYYVFCVVGAPLPTAEQFKYEEGLTTGKLKELLSSFRERNNGNEPRDFQAFVLKHHGISYGKGALKFFLDDEIYKETTQGLEKLRQLIQSVADLRRLEEFEDHAALDGAVHSIIIPDTRNRRGGSRTPNVQNIAMTKAPWPGLFEGFIGGLMEIDYRNAEVKMENITSGDDAAADAAEEGDMHSKMAMVYWPDKAVMNPATGKITDGDLRNLGKRVTFGTKYGAGVYKTALMVKCPMDEARQILANKDRIFWKTKQHKDKIEANIKKRMQRGAVPVFVTGWSGERYQIDRFRSRATGEIDVIAFTGWNSLMQGGVTAMIARADILISEMLEREGHRTRVLFDVHDSLIFDFDIEEYKTDLPVRILEIMASIMPEEFARRTTPKTHMIADICPASNSKKWGYHPHKEYPFDCDEFITPWGRYPYPDEILSDPVEKREAPPWNGPVPEGWTLEKETKTISAERSAQEFLSDQGGVVASQVLGEKWVELHLLLKSFECEIEDDLRLALKLQLPMKIMTDTPEDNTVNEEHLVFSSWMAVNEVLAHRDPGARQSFEGVRELVFSLVRRYDHFDEWRTRYEPELSRSV